MTSRKHHKCPDKLAPSSEVRDSCTTCVVKVFRIIVQDEGPTGRRCAGLSAQPRSRFQLSGSVQCSLKTRAPAHFRGRKTERDRSLLSGVGGASQQHSLVPTEVDIGVYGTTTADGPLPRFPAAMLSR